MYRKTKILLIVLVVGLLAWLVWLHAKPAWPGVAYVEVRAYAYNSKGQGDPALFLNGILNDTVINRDGVLLNKDQVHRLIDAVTLESEQYAPAACFNPRHAFVFYSADHQPVANIRVCFQCLNYETKPYNSILYCDFQSLAKLCDELNLPLSPGPGFNTYFYESTHPQVSHNPPSLKPGESLDPFAELPK